MGLFVCAKCNCVENTALGHWWSRHRVELFTWTEEIEKFKGEGLCSEHMPTEFSDGKPIKDSKTWHNKFPKEDIKDFLKRHPEMCVIEDGLNKGLIIKRY